VEETAPHVLKVTCSLEEKPGDAPRMTERMLARVAGITLDRGFLWFTVLEAENGILRRETLVDGPGRGWRPVPSGIPAGRGARDFDPDRGVARITRLAQTAVWVVRLDKDWPGDVGKPVYNARKVLAGRPRAKEAGGRNDSQCTGRGKSPGGG
jgi:hypothetical protein